MSSVNLHERLQCVQKEIKEAEQRFGRQPGSVRLLAVSKTRTAADILALAQLGVADFGENQVQEAQAKIEQLRGHPLTWHFIGPIQSNKTRQIAENFDWVHSVERSKIAGRLHAARPPDLPPLNICIQVNIDAEPSKSGLTRGAATTGGAPAAADAAEAERAHACPHLRMISTRNDARS